ncbi:MAG: helix-turn-helix domain-containing protein [Bacteroidales bacterium]|jgi:transcriptional regulator with XRE-family HTH domain|nr:helix-turn-helix domain-containing protein [Bacteroidales bacterium]
MANLHIIRSISETKKITLRELASQVGIGESALQSLIRKGSTNTTTLEAIAQALNVPVGVFFGENQEERPITQTGKINAIGKNKITVSDCESKLEIAKNKIAALETLVAEKDERLKDKEEVIEMLKYRLKHLETSK